ncbi:MAG: formamidopyrimidine-DNA glycosylase [Homavirus sp.]|uniref:DNA-formamidopyrimidine glycosylase n=1 Tax=Homavirus sp. TaxID=2487769 RepID=A0A3G5A487_9VIRU|nr:MAG: formamidopyrimidine-DNA glycosylase [Homavirus sp.]
MPEVVEVCLTAIFLESKLKNTNIVDIIIHGGRYKRHGMPDLNNFKKNLPMKIEKIDSHGKFMWFELSNKKQTMYIMNTFGLEGEWGFTKQKHSNVEFVIKKDNKTRSLYFTDSRNFGTINITDSGKQFCDKYNILAPDLLKTDFTNAEFYNRVKNYILDNNGNILKQRANKEIIKILMTQNIPMSLGSGLGNYLSVEVLYRARISPHTKMLQLYSNRTLCNRIAQSIRFVTKLSFMTASIGYLEHLDPKMDKFIKNLRSSINGNKNHKYNFHPSVKINKEVFKFKVYKQKNDPKGNKVKADKIISGRTTYWVPNIQK